MTNENGEDFVDHRDGEQLPGEDSVDHGAAPPPDGAAPTLGSAIGSQFDQPTPPAPSPAPPSPAPPVSQQTTSAGSTPPPPVVTPPPASQPPTGQPPTTTPQDASFSSAYTTPPATEQNLVVPEPFSSGGSSKLPWIAAVIAAVVLLGGGAFFAASALGASGGEASPEEAIDALLAAAENEDFVTVAELMEPSERRTIAEPALTELLPELIRIGALDDSADASSIDGVDLTFTDVEHRVERPEGADDIAHVFLTGGEVSTSVDGESLPLSDDLDSGDLDQQNITTITEDLDSPLVFVERDGNWFFSLWFTVAEAARLDAGERLPSIDEAPAAIPNDSPEAAVEGLFTSISDFDLEAVIGHLDPEELAALYRYSPLFLDDAQAQLDEASGDLRAEGIIWEIGDFDFDVDQNGDDAVVEIRGFTVNFAADSVELDVTYSRDQLLSNFDFDGVVGTVDATTTDISVTGSADGSTFDADALINPEQFQASGSLTVDGDSFQGSVVLDPAGECSAFEFSGTDGTEDSGCLEDEFGFEGVAPVLEILESWPNEFPGIPIRTRQTDGGWYVSPIGTAFDGVISSLEELEEGDFDDVFDPVAGAAGDAVLDPFDALDSVTGGGTDDDFTIEDFEEDFGPLEDFATEDFDDLDDFGQRALNLTVTADLLEDEVFEEGGVIDSDTFDVYSVDLPADATVVATVQARNDSGFDSILTVFAPDGSELDRNDDAPVGAGLDGLESQVIITTPVEGTYSFEVSGFGTSDGDYQFTVDRSDDATAVDALPADDDPAVDDPSADDQPPAQDGEVITRDLEAESGATTVELGTVRGFGGRTEYLVDFTAGDELLITVESTNPDFDPVVALTLDGSVIDRNDDADDSSAVPQRFDSQLITSVPEDGEYAIVIDGFAGSDGSFRLIVERN